jgi:general L-amino acid transport system permease protein
MTALRQNFQTLFGGEGKINFNAGQFVQENITRSVWLTLWLLLLTYITVTYTLSQLQTAPILTIAVLAVWLVSLAMTIINEITRRHIPATRWLKENLYSSITNVQISLLLVLLIVAGLRGFIDYSFVRASYTTDHEQAAANFEAMEARGIEPGANWGAVRDNMRNLMVFRFPRGETWRVIAVPLLLIILAVPSFIVYRQDKYRRSPIRRTLTIIWLLSPIIVFILLKGVGERGPVSSINPQQFWGGLLLTLVIAVFGIVASFPLGLFMALGRRSQIRGVPGWLTWTVAVAFTIWGLAFKTPDALDAARSSTERIVAYWPLIIPVIAYLFQRYFKGNVVALFSTLYIEAWRGVPFITVLFMSIILFPIFLPPGVEILGIWRVLVATAIFASAYLAENVRGGLQSIPNGQYEAADSLGLNTFQKYRLIILPQALRAVIPAIVGQFIGLFKDTTLVAIVGLIDLLGAANLISAQPDWLGVRREPYIFIAIIYFVGSAVMAGYSRRLEAQLGVGER